jgi:hypothetical protein
MLVIDSERSEYGPQRRKDASGRRLHCCCICGRLDRWGDGWSCYCSIKDLEDGVPIPKFCSLKCRNRGGPDAANVTEEMKRVAKAAEWREPKIAYREASDIQKYTAAAAEQQRRTAYDRGET